MAGAHAPTHAQAAPTVSSVPFDSLGLRAELLQAVAGEGYTHPTPIQAGAIPAVLTRRDLLAAAQTGTGKTAGFTLPILQILTTTNAPAREQSAPPREAPRGRSGGKARAARWPVRVLVLVPTRELAAQVEASVRTYGKHLPAIRSTTIFGGVSMQNQIHALDRGVDIVVATPGRLLDHVGERTIDLSTVEIVVLDEADRMLDMGFIHDLKKILALLPSKRQTLMFSATFSPDIRKLAGQFLDSPQTVEVARNGTPAELVTQVVHPVDAARKRELLAHLIQSGDWQQVLVFTRTKHGANRLAQQLEKGGITSDAIHGNKAQNARTRALADFKAGKVRVLVATDIAARGLDIEALPHVVNFDLPNVAEDYVHRIGRTGRAGSSGVAVSLVCGEDRDNLRGIERLIGRTIPAEPVAGFDGPSLAPPPPAPQRNSRGGRDTKPARDGRDRPARGRDGERASQPPRRDAPRPQQPAQQPAQRDASRPPQRRDSERGGDRPRRHRDEGRQSEGQGGRLPARTLLTDTPGLAPKRPIERRANRPAPRRPDPRPAPARVAPPPRPAPPPSAPTQTVAPEQDARTDGSKPRRGFRQALASLLGVRSDER